MHSLTSRPCQPAVLCSSSYGSRQSTWALTEEELQREADEVRAKYLGWKKRKHKQGTTMSSHNKAAKMLGVNEMTGSVLAFGNAEDAAEKGKAGTAAEDATEPDGPSPPPYPIVLLLTCIFASFVLLQYHFRWGSNGNDGLPGTLDKKARGRPWRLALLFLWYLPMLIFPFFIVFVIGPGGHHKAGSACVAGWSLSLIFMVTRSFVFPSYFNADGSRIVYPDGTVKPPYYNSRLFTTQRHIRMVVYKPHRSFLTCCRKKQAATAKSRWLAKCNWRNHLGLVTELILLFQWLYLIPKVTSIYVGHRCNGCYVALEDVLALFELDIFRLSGSDTAAMDADVVIIWAKVKWWFFTGMCVVWVITFAHFACKPDAILRV